MKEILGDIQDAGACDGRNSSAGNQILWNIHSTISHQAATHKRINELLQGYKDEILPDIIDNLNFVTFLRF